MQVLRRQVNNGREKQVCFGESLKDDDILKIIDDKDAKATKNVTADGALILHEYLQVKDG